MKKNMKKIIVVALAVAMLALAAVAGTLAWLHDQATVIGGTYALGDIGIVLTADTLPDEILIPNRAYNISPEATIEANSEDCYVRMLVTFNDAADIIATMGTEVNGAKVFLPQNYVAGWKSDVWKTTNVITSNEDDNTITYEFRYYKIVKKSAENQTLPKLFTTFQLDEWLNDEQIALLDNLSITVVAQAMQAVDTNLQDNGSIGEDRYLAETTAWEKFDQQMKNNPNQNSFTVTPAPTPAP